MRPRPRSIRFQDEVGSTRRNRSLSAAGRHGSPPRGHHSERPRGPASRTTPEAHDTAVALSVNLGLAVPPQRASGGAAGSSEGAESHIVDCFPTLRAQVARRGPVDALAPRTPPEGGNPAEPRMSASREAPEGRKRPPSCTAGSKSGGKATRRRRASPRSRKMGLQPRLVRLLLDQCGGAIEGIFYAFPVKMKNFVSAPACCESGGSWGNVLAGSAVALPVLPRAGSARYRRRRE